MSWASAPTRGGWTTSPPPGSADGPPSAAATWPSLERLGAAGGQEAADRDHLALVLAEEELLLARREQARRDPLWAGRVLGVTSYLTGPAATAAERADGLRRHLAQVPDALDGLAAGLEEVPLAFREAATDVFSGYASFYRTEVAALAGAEVAEPAAAAVERYAATVAALDGPPLAPWGPADFAELVRVRTGTALDPAVLLARGRAEADRQLAAQREAAARAGGTPGEVRARAAKAPPPPASCWQAAAPRWTSAASSWSTAASCHSPATSRPGSRRPRRTCAAPSPSTRPRGRSTRCAPPASATT